MVRLHLTPMLAVTPVGNEIILSQWSATAAYVTSGDAPKPAQAQKEAPAAQKSRQKNKAAKAKPEKQQAKDVDSEEERERLEVSRRLGCNAAVIASTSRGETGRLEL